MISIGPYPVYLPSEILAFLPPYSMWLRFLLGSVILLYAVWSDLLHRRVKNEVWIVTLVLGGLLAGYDLLQGAPPTAYLIGVPIIMAVAYGLWKVRLLFGGADAKCIMAFALLVPYPPALAAGDGTLYPHFIAFLPTAVTMLTNAVMLTLFIPVGYFLLNVVRGNFHPVAMFLGTRVKLERVFEDPVWVMEWVHPKPGTADDVEEGLALDQTSEDPDLDDEGLPTVDAATIEGADVRLHYMPTRAGDYALNLARLRKMDIDTVWVTPKVAFMIPLFLGFLLSFLAGDVIMSAMLYFTGGL